MTARDNGRWTVPLVLVLAAVGGSLLAALVVRTDIMTGRAHAVTAAEAACGDLPELPADLSATIPDNALTAVHGLLPMLPLRDLGAVAVAGFNQYPTAGQYAHFSSTLLSGRTESAMEANGFRVANTIGYDAGSTFFGAEAFQFGSPAQAAEFERTVLVVACRAGVVNGVRTLAGLPGGVMFVYHDWDRSPFRATFLVGDTVVRLNVCICAEDRADPFVVLDNWARAVNARMRAPLS